MPIEDVHVGRDAHDHVIPDSLVNGWDRRSLRRRLVVQPIPDVDDDAVGRGKDWLPITEVAIALRRIVDPGAELIVEAEEVDREPLRHRELAVYGDKPAAVVGDVAAAPFARQPYSGSDGRAEHRWLRLAGRDARHHDLERD